MTFLAFGKVLEHAWVAYSKNLKLISAFSIPFLIAFPLSFLLPNFVAMSAAFLRIGSVKLDLGVLDVLIIVLAFIASLVFFSFAVAAINVVIRSQRTLNRLTSRDMEAIERATVNLFFILLTAFAAIVGFSLLLFENGIDVFWSGVFSLVVSSMVLFAPQAVVIEDASLSGAVAKSVLLIRRKPGFFLLFVVFAAVLFLINTWVFLELSKGLWFARFVSLIVQSLLILPFLEVLKTQIYLSKYALL
ncbi:TPA: hypothetical protein HA244_01510 [Candidatus Micrarchaeota archaeon]|nr:hypothetical protein [Candidatus Micrarchaeota archaeon]